LALTLSVLSGCGSASGGADTSPTSANVASSEGTGSTSPTALPNVTIAGRSYRWVKKATIAEPNTDPIPTGPITIFSLPDAGEPEQTQETPVPFALVGGHEYTLDVAAQPPAVNTQTTQAGSEPNAQVAEAGAGAPVEPSSDASTKDSISMAPQYIIQGNRYPATPSQLTSYPYNTVGYLSTSQGSCTAFLVQPNTVMTAGHCIYNNGKWFTINFFAPGGDASSGNYPYGTFSGDYVNLITNNLWMQGNTNFDYGFIQFLDSEPGLATNGTLSMRDNSSGSMNLAGYPSDKNGQMWISPGNVTAVYTSYYKTNQDTVGGNSGGPMIDSSLFGTGVAVREMKYCACIWWCCSYWTEVTRFNSSVDTFMFQVGIY
jgi:V8-like Glu-specific endopeptidase